MGHGKCLQACFRRLIGSLRTNTVSIRNGPFCYRIFSLNLRPTEPSIAMSCTRTVFKRAPCTGLRLFELYRLLELFQEQSQKKTLVMLPREPRSFPLSLGTPQAKTQG